MANTYLVIGRVERDIGIIDPIIERKNIHQEIDAEDSQSAIGLLQTEGWEFIEAPTIRLITEAQKLERRGSITVPFAADERKLKMKSDKIICPVCGSDDIHHLAISAFNRFLFGCQQCFFQFGDLEEEEPPKEEGEAKNKKSM